MKKTLLLSIALILFGLSSFAQWESLYSGTSNFVTSVYFTNIDTGWCCGFGGTILKTTDGGNTWDPELSGTINDLYCIFFINPDTGYTVGSAGTILKTSDGGTNWVPQSSGTANIIVNVFFIGNTGYAAGDGTTLLKTTNGGQNWTSITNGAPAANYKAVYFTSVDTGFTVCDPGYILKTTNGGSNWNVVYTDLISLYFSVFFTNTQIGYVAGGDQTTGQILKTTNGGETWAMVPNITSGSLRRIYFPDAIAGWAVSKFGDIIHTIDAGEHWTAQQSGTTAFLFGLFFINESTGYASGQDGTILKTLNGGFPVGINEKQQSNSLKINPNPATEKITIESSVTGSSLNGTVSVYGIAGQELIRQQVQGSRVEINISSLQKGVYFIRLMNSEKTVSGKFVKN